MGPLLQGVILGLTFAVLLGPAFFALIQTSIHRGFRSGALLATGIFLSDFFALVVCYLGASQIVGSDPRENVYFSVIGGIIMVIFGTFTFSRKAEKHKDESGNPTQEKKPKFYVFIIKGFFLNAMNPGMWFLWITIVISVSATYGANNQAIMIFIIGALSTIYATDLLKCFVSHQIKHIVNDTVMTWMNRLVGIIIIGIGVYLVFRVFVDMERIISLYKDLFNE